MSFPSDRMIFIHHFNSALSRALVPLQERSFTSPSTGCAHGVEILQCSVRNDITKLHYLGNIYWEPAKCWALL